MRDLAVQSWRRAYRPVATAARDHARALLRIETARSRLMVTAAIFLVCFGALTIRILDLAVVGFPGDRHAYAGGQASRQAARADIVDRNGVLLATDLPTHSLYVDPRAVLDAEDAALRLAAVLPDLDPVHVIHLARSDKRFAWVRRDLTPEQVHAVNGLGLPGFGFRRETRRVYPQGTLFAHALGFTDVDNRGLAGVEMAADETLRGQGRDGGKPLALTLDTRVQHVVRAALGDAMTKHRALGAAGIVIDVETGAVLSLVSLPSFDPNAPDQSPAHARFNRATLGTYELGSTFKAFTAAMALDLGLADLGDRYDATEPLRVSRHVIRDSHPENRWLTLREIVTHSSNIGAARVGLQVGTKRQRAFLDALGLLSPSNIELPERGRPILPPRWNDLSTMTISFGHGIAVTPLHLASGFATLVNGGLRVAPTLLLDTSAEVGPGARVIGADTSATVRSLLRSAVSEGTGSRAAAPGYLVGGKTGTAEKAARGGYRRNALIATFVGAVPIDRPRYVILATLDEPKGTKATHGFAGAGWTAAPVVGDIIARIGPLLGLPPDGGPSDPAGGPMVINFDGTGGRLASF